MYARQPGGAPGGDQQQNGNGDNSNAQGGKQPNGPTPATPPPGNPNEQKPEGNAIYKIDREGFVTEIFRENVIIYSLIAQGDVLLVGACIGWIVAEGETFLPPTEKVERAEAPSAETSPVAAEEKSEAARAGAILGARPRATPAAIKLTADKLARGRRWMLRFGDYDLDIEASRESEQAAPDAGAGDGDNGRPARH